MRRRVFLNRPQQHSVGSVYAYVGKDATELKIADCNRVVDLDFNGYEADDRENGLYKIDTLIAVLSEFRDALRKKYEAKDRKAKG